jgi:flagellar biosynthesis/type III secretory pathway chaperone
VGGEAVTGASELALVLEREAKIVRELLEILQLDQQRIVRHDVEGLEASNLAKEELVLAFQGLEQARQELTARLGRELGLAADEVRVSRLCPLLGAEGEPLREAAERLRALVASLGELLALSRGFVEQSILGVRTLLGLIQSLRTPEPAGYDAAGRLLARNDPGALALRREV